MTELQAALKDADRLLNEGNWWVKIQVDEKDKVTMDVGIINFSGMREQAVTKVKYYTHSGQVRCTKLIHS